jgi:hypothetical protein
VGKIPEYFLRGLTSDCSRKLAAQVFGGSDIVSVSVRRKSGENKSWALVSGRRCDHPQNEQPTKHHTMHAEIRTLCMTQVTFSDREEAAACLAAGKLARSFRY